LEATVTTPDSPHPQNPRPDGQQIDPEDALRDLDRQPRVDEQGFPTAYTAVPPPLGQQQDPYAEQPYGRQGQQPPGYGYPPPPAPEYGNAPYGSAPYGSAPYGTGQPPGMPPYAGWGQRVGAWLIDNIVAAIGISLAEAAYYDWGNGARVVAWVVLVAGVAWSLYNAYLAGKTGQSTGKRTVGIRLARYADGQVVGPAFAFLRLFMNVVFWVICFIPGLLNYLWPLWDQKSQTWSDKIASSVVVRAR
jgi:uncharacterized RDD family membrane protein YckC